MHHVKLDFPLLTKATSTLRSMCTQSITAHTKSEALICNILASLSKEEVQCDLDKFPLVTQESIQVAANSVGTVQIYTFYFV